MDMLKRSSYLSFSFKFSADVAPELAGVQGYVDGSKAQGNISKVAVGNKPAKLQLRLDIARYAGNANRKQ